MQLNLSVLQMSIRTICKDARERYQLKDYINTSKEINVGQEKGITVETQAIKQCSTLPGIWD